MYDIIGDIHGHADELVELLEKLGYSECSGVFRHPDRTVIFCGDFIDRGPQIPDVVRLAKTMVEHGAAQAVMGNHEFNALAYHTSDPDDPAAFLRPHSERNRKQHAKTLDQFSDADLNTALDWFRTLPTCLDLGELRIVHACWSSRHLSVIDSAFETLGTFTHEFLKQATTPGNPLFDAVECVLKGPELPLPDGVTVTDKEGNIRRRIRIRWFESPKNQTWASYSLPIKPELPSTPVPGGADAQPYPADAPPLFIGHYWLPDSVPVPLRPNIACLDYSIAKDGMICAYRHDGEATLREDRFVTVSACRARAS